MRAYAAAFFIDQLNSVPSIHMRCRMTASFRATAVDIFDLLLNGLACLEQRPDRSNQLRMIFDQPLGAHCEDIELGAADDETEVLKQATDLVLEITLDLD
jgi:hypothetical protein